MSTPKRIIWDIETAPLPAAELSELMPDFDPAANLKDPDKIAASIAAKRVKWIEDAALDATTGRVLAVGYIKGDEFHCIHGRDEKTVLEGWWGQVRATGSDCRMTDFIGFNTTGFDLPFLIRRSWIIGVAVPLGIREGRYFARNWIDLRNEWNFNGREAKGSLDSICRACGLGKKTGSGAAFAMLYDTDTTAALAYLENDVMLTEKLAERIL